MLGLLAVLVLCRSWLLPPVGGSGMPRFWLTALAAGAVGMIVALELLITQLRRGDPNWRMLIWLAALLLGAATIARFVREGHFRHIADLTRPTGFRSEPQRR